MQVRAKKRFGQNFLKDRSILHTIIKSKPKNDHLVVEIGPGLGDLTQELLKIADVKAFEIDEELCPLLQEKFQEELTSGKLELVCADVIEQWEGSLTQKDYDLVANLPYYVATNIVLKALQDSRCKNILVMLQKEVADKFSAKVREREFCALSVLAQSVGEAKRVCVVKPNSFSPAPKVDSAVLLIKKSKNLEERDFMQFLKVAFSQPRKKLLKNLSSRYDKELLKNLFEKLQLPLTLRPHEADTSIYHQIFQQLKEQIDGKRSKAK